MSTRVNESILNDEIREHQKENRIDHMKYLPGMEVLDSDIPDQVIAAMDAYDYDRYTDADVNMRSVLSKILRHFFHRQHCRI